MKAKRPEGSIGVGVFSASSPISATVPVRYERGAQFLAEKGFRVIHGSLCGKQDGYRSGSIRQRAEEFNELLYRDDVDIIMSAIGGMNTNAILPYIDYAYLKQHPKIIVGYSDTTALLLAVYAKTGLVTFYGPALAASFGEFPPFVEKTYEAFRAMLENPPVPYACAMPPYWTEEFIPWDRQDRSKQARENRWLTVRSGAVRGRLIGGNLNTVGGIFGTDYMPQIREGDILLLEDSLKDAATVERSFSLMKLAGVLDRVGGIILGKHELFDDCGTGRRPHEILLEVMGEREIPVLAEFDCCHTHPMLTLPIGCEVRLDADEKTVELLEQPLET